MQSIRQYQRIKAQVRDTCLNGDVARIEQWIDTDSSTPVEEGEKLSSTPISHSHIPGVQLQNAVGNDGQKEHVFIVGWNGDIDPMRPQNWSLTRRWVATLMLCLVSMIVSAASSIDAAVEPQFSKAFHVTDDVGSLTTGKCVSLLFFFFFPFSFFYTGSGFSNLLDQVVTSSASPLGRLWQVHFPKPLAAISCT